MGEGARIGDVAALLARGDNLRAYDLVANELERPGAQAATKPADWLRLRYLGGLSLARSGARGQAEQVLQGIADASVDALEPALAEDIAALDARLAKDRAVNAAPSERQVLLAEAASRYESVFRKLDRGFAGVNAATLWYLAGELDHARALAREVIDLVHGRPEAVTSTDAYWSAVTEAEASLVLGEYDVARRALLRACDVGFDDVGARASTRRQIRLLADDLGLDHRELLAGLTNPDVVHYCGHRMAAPDDDGRLIPAEERSVRAAIDAWLDDCTVGSAHGALASGADIIAAEALIERGASLHVVLPCELTDFVEQSVAPAGPAWVDRFQRCLDAATTVTVTCDSASCGEDVLFAHASEVAMGEALNRARTHEAEARQLAVWDGEEPDLGAGTAHDVATWAAIGGSTHVVSVGGREIGRAPAATGSVGLGRERRAALFGDLTHFSRLRDEQVPAFVGGVMAAISDVLDERGEDVLFSNTWGDGLFVIASDVTAGAEIGLGIQEALSELDLAGSSLPGEMSMRLAGHFGPLIPVHDPVLGADLYMGRELTRVARIVPRTPPGEVYVTAAFAALLALDGETDIAAEYVGHVTTAKSFETLPMYVLRRR